MSETLKFGNGQWATKVGSTLAYNDEGGNFKPLPFNFTRSTSATRINKDGLIEVVSNNKPRIDFLNDSNGALLLEPIRINLFPYSEDFTNNAWNKTRTTAAANSTTSPNGGVNASLITATESTAGYVFDGATLTQGLKYFVSVFFKQGSYGGNVIISDFTESGVVTFNLTTKTIITSGIASDASYEDYGNGWFRVMASITPTISTGNHNIVFGNFGGVGNSIYIWGAQLEAGSYPTSYIPTQGAISTRVADVCNGAGNSQIFNDSEGVLFAEISALANDLTFRLISLSDGTTSNRLSLGYRSTSNAIYCEIRNANVPNDSVFLITTINDIKTKSKVSVKYKENDFAMWVNGFEVSTDTSGITPVNLSKINFDSGQINGSFFYGNTKQIAYYDEILTDLELEYITSYRSLNEMVTELNLNAL
jgi:hypothetical protein